MTTRRNERLASLRNRKPTASVIYIRTTPEQVELFKKVADLLDMPISRFVLHAALDRANEVVKDAHGSDETPKANESDDGWTSIH